MNISAIRSGDYYLFEESEDEDVEEEDELTTLTYGQDKDEDGDNADPMKVGGSNDLITEGMRYF
jgi:hypothetical protein